MPSQAQVDYNVCMLVESSGLHIATPHDKSSALRNLQRQLEICNRRGEVPQDVAIQKRLAPECRQTKPRRNTAALVWSTEATSRLGRSTSLDAEE